MARSDFPDEEFADRIRRVQAAMARDGLDVIVLVHPSSIHWLTGSDAKSYQAFQCLIVRGDDGATTMITRESERNEFEAEARIGALETWGGNEPADPIPVFKAVAQRLGLAARRVGLEVPSYYLHPYHYNHLKEILGTALVKEPLDLVQRMKMVKSPRELAYVRRAARIADDAMQAFASGLAPGRSELSLSGDIYRVLLGADGGLPASTINLVSGERAGFSHGPPTERQLTAGDFGNVEYGAVYRRYTVTIGRQFAVGAPTPRMQALYDVVRRAADAMLAGIRDGVPAIVPHQAAKRVIADAGFDRYRIHTSGYSIEAGFPPSWGGPLNMFGPTTDVIAAGMVLSVEPPIFIGAERLGARLIDNVIVTETGCELLSTFSRDLIVV